MTDSGAEAEYNAMAAMASGRFSEVLTVFRKQSATIDMQRQEIERLERELQRAKDRYKLAARLALQEQA